jgi:hypothetical protein
MVELELLVAHWFIYEPQAYRGGRQGVVHEDFDIVVAEGDHVPTLQLESASIRIKVPVPLLKS